MWFTNVIYLIFPAIPSLNKALEKLMGQVALQA